MDLKQLRYFSAVYERRNLSHAAQQCCVAQSAISHHMSRLELELGTRLFERVARGMEPTPAGTRLYEHAQAILRSVSAAASDVHQMSDVITGEINLGLPHTVIDAIAVPLLISLKRDLPQARIILHEAFSSELYRQVLQGEHDLVFCYNVPADERLKLVHVHSEPLCCAGSPELLGDENKPIAIEEVLSLPHIVLRRGEDARSISNQPRFAQALQSQAMFELNSVNGMRKAITGGLAVAVCPYITVRDLADRGALTVRPIAEPVAARSLYIARLTERLPTRLMETVQNLVLSLIREQTGSGSWPIHVERD